MMVVWNGGRCVEGFCLAAPADVATASAADEFGISHAQVDEALELGLVDGRVFSIRMAESIFYRGDELIGDDVQRVADLLIDGTIEEQAFILPDGSTLTVIGGRRHDFDIEVWGASEGVSSVHITDFEWIEG